MGGFGDFEMVNGVMSVAFPVMFAVVLVFIIVIAARGVKEWAGNNRKPKIPATANIVAKRTKITQNQEQDGLTTTNTAYYATFQFASGDRQEFRVPAREYGCLAEGDAGVLTFQGTRFIGFEREIT
ncbi:membrane protein [Clostridia bacterium]|nr:membrane protein [Clostridia bacterium]